MLIDIDPGPSQPLGGPAARDEDLQRALRAPSLRPLPGNAHDLMLAGLAFGRPTETNAAGPACRHVDILAQQELVGLLCIEIDRDLELCLPFTRPVDRGPDIEGDLIGHGRRRDQGQSCRRLRGRGKGPPGQQYREGKGQTD